MNSKLKNSFNKIWSWMTSSSNPITRLWNDYTGNTAIDKQLSHQQAENEATREYNLQLAEKQNNWNIQQWQRENEYNLPSAQKARLEAAGLNPDLMYGAGGVMNTSASSPQMTAGAPASPTDWTSLGRKTSLAESLLSQKNLEMIDAQIDNVKAQSRKTLAEAGLSEISLDYAAAKERIGLNLSEQAYKNAQQDYELGVKAIEKAAIELENLSLDKANKMIRNAYEAEIFDNTLKKLQEELKITKEQAKNAAQYYAAQLLGLQADNAWKDAAWIVQQKDGVPTLIKYGSEALSELMDNLIKFIPIGKPKKFKKMSQHGNVLTWK